MATSAVAATEACIENIHRHNETLNAVVTWDEPAALARAAAEAAPDMFVPVRVIESVQEDGAVIFELFREGQPGEPAAEVKLVDGKAEMLTERWAY